MRGGVHRANGSAPSYLWIPPGSDFTAADEAADLARDLGDQVGEPEIAALRVLLAEDGRGKRATLESALIAGRQNIKTWAGQRGSVLYRGWVQDLDRIVWTAQLFKTAQDTLQELEDLIDAHTWLGSKVLHIRRNNNDPGIDLRNGCRIDFLARSPRNARGLAADEIVDDEGLFMTPGIIGAVMPTLSSKPDPHISHLSSPGIPASEVLRNIRKRGRALNDPYLAYAEWTSPRGQCAAVDCDHQPGTPGCLLDREEYWYLANPALGRRITIEYVRGERRALPIGEFMRERMGWWEDPPSAEQARLFPKAEWDALCDPTSRIAKGSALAIGVDTDWNRSTTWIAVAGHRADGIRHVEVLPPFNSGGRAFLAAKAKAQTRMPKAIGLQSTAGAPVSSQVEHFDAEFGDVCHKLTGTDIARAHGDFVDALAGTSPESFRHIGQKPLTDAVGAAHARAIGEAAVIDRAQSSNGAAVVAAQIALYLLDTVEESAPPEIW